MTSGVRGIFFSGGKVTFPEFFSWREICFFPVKILSILVNPNKIQNSVVSKSDKQKKKKRKEKILAHFRTFPPLIFQFSTSSLSNFPSFPLHFPFLPCPSFPSGSAKVSPVKNVRGVLCNPPKPVTPLIMTLDKLNIGYKLMLGKIVMDLTLLLNHCLQSKSTPAWHLTFTLCFNNLVT